MNIKSELIKLTLEFNFVSTFKNLNTKYYFWQCELQQWFRDTHHIRILPIHRDHGTVGIEIRKWNFDNNIGKWQRFGFIPSYNTYEEALEIGLYEAFQILKL